MDMVNTNTAKANGMINKSMPKVPKPWGIIIFIINILLPGVGTMIAACVSDGPVEMNAIIVGII